MIRYTIVALAATAVLSTVLISTNALAFRGNGGFPGSFGGPHFNGAFARPDFRADRRDIFRDRFDVRRDFRDLRRDRRFGTPADIARDRADIRQDRIDLRRDRRDLRMDQW
jgi:hypothetical protein